MKFKAVNLTFGYTEKNLFENISFELEKGILVIIGQSGSGKTTLLKTISGLLPLKNGKLFFDDNEFTNQPVEKRNIGMVFQDYALFPHLTVYQNITFALKNKKDPFIDKIVDMLNIREILSHYPHQISGGQAQRVALARSIVVKPKLLLMDEPFSNLDYKIKVKIREELRAILENLGIACIVVTHDQEDAEFLADQMIKI